MASLFDRPTPLEGDRGMEQWLNQFAGHYFDGLPVKQRREAIQQTVEGLRPHLFGEGKWRADYRRLRVVAHKLR